ncbi:fatty-acid amide hydrolase 1 [Elysia marginata]|uniref:fatty acid amide hydrolase n=1 Tax=Elysia marginata TaxID=1093978 RepID=A0AAV4HZA7_9GAST|nr:fatty-acid amide hydrolase 1 [Elysia marginata]
MDRIASFFNDRIKSSLGNYVVGVTAATVVCIPATYFIYGRYMRGKMNQKIHRRAQRSQENIEEMKDDLAKHAAIIDENILQLSFRDLQKGLQDGNISATAALRSYQAKALEVNDEINAITDVLEDAKVTASKLDSLPSSERGPLHGIPISLKESCGIKGRDCTAGFGEMIDVPWEEDGVLVKVLKSQGAVPFVRTNLPQGMRSFACTNPIYGQTCNPHNKSRSPGGSSGGEGAIIGGEGSILGVGSDIGGSIRIPANFCGIYALKPTAGRLSMIGNFGTGALGGQKLVPPTDGPMGKDVESLVQFMEAVLCQELFRLDPSTPPIPFRRDMYENWKPLKIGYYVYDECSRCVPAVERAVMLAKAALEKLGHTLVETKPYKAAYSLQKILIPAFVADDGDGYKDLLKYDDSCGVMYELFNFHRKSYRERWFWAKLKELTGYDPMVTGAMKREQIRTMKDWFLKANEAKKFRKEFTETWREQGLDAVICPCMPCVANTSGVDGQLLSAVTYTSLYNVVNFPAGTLPVTKVTKTDVAKTMDSSFYEAKTGIEKIIQADSEGTEGLPVGIQIVGLPYTEELVLRLMRELDNALKNGAP